jgi:hypothetical protein
VSARSDLFRLRPADYFITNEEALGEPHQETHECHHFHFAVYHPKRGRIFRATDLRLAQELLDNLTSQEMGERRVTDLAPTPKE